MADRPYNQYGPHLCSEDRWDQLCTWLTGNSNFRLQLAGHKQALRDHMGYSQEASDPSNKARRTVSPQEREAPRLQQHRLRPMGGPVGGSSRVVDSRVLPHSNRLLVARPSP